jgi:hypothetical protein
MLSRPASPWSRGNVIVGRESMAPSARQTRPVRAIADSILLIWFASQAEEWRNRIVYLPI